MASEQRAVRGRRSPEAPGETPSAEGRIHEMGLEMVHTFGIEQSCCELSLVKDLMINNLREFWGLEFVQDRSKIRQGISMDLTLSQPDWIDLIMAVEDHVVISFSLSF